MKKLFAIVVSLILAFSCSAFADSGNYLFIQTEEGIFISGYEGSETVIRLPEAFKDEPVVGISEGAFKGNRNIVEVYVPDSYRVIGVEAFADCTSLRDVYLGAGIELIDERAFRGCTALLSVSIVQYDFYEDATAFDSTADEIPYNGADINYYRENNDGYDYEWLYIAACDMMSRGEFEAARDVFLSLYGYELSSDYYFYCCARIYEQRGDIDAALAIYALTPDLNDCQARLDYYNGEAEVESFFEGTAYETYYDHYFGEGGSYAGWLEGSDENAVADAEPEATEAPAAGEAQTGIGVGGGLNNVTANQEDTSAEPEGETIDDENAEAEPTEAPADDVQVSATIEPNPALMSYQDFTGDMPYSYDNRSISDGYFALYFYYDDVQQIYDYAALFESQGWVTMEESDTDGWEYIYVINEETEAYFMIGYTEADKMVVFMYESALPYDFDPVNGL